MSGILTSAFVATHAGHRSGWTVRRPTLESLTWTGSRQATLPGSRSTPASRQFLRSSSTRLVPDFAERSWSGLAKVSPARRNRSARPDSSALAMPLYPDSLHRQRISGRVLAEFVVDTAGRPEAETIGIVSSTDP